MNIVKTFSRILWDNIVSKFATVPNYRVSIGKHTYGNPHVVTTHDGKVSIGKFCSIADDVAIVGDNHSYSRVANYPLPWWLENIKKVPFEQPEGFHRRRELPIVIGNDVWIGAGAIILPEVKIGDGAIIGGGAVVTHDIPAYAIAVGVPAKILRYRFTQDRIQQLLKIAWWNWDDDKIVKNIKKFYNDVDDFIKEFGTSLDDEENQ